LHSEPKQAWPTTGHNAISFKQLQSKQDAIMNDTPRILVVDDEQSICLVLKLNLQLSGYEVDTATSAEQALKLPLERYDLLLLDVMLERMDGYELARQIRQHDHVAQHPHHLLHGPRHRGGRADGIFHRSRRLYQEALLDAGIAGARAERAAPQRCVAQPGRDHVRRPQADACQRHLHPRWRGRDAHTQGV